jgi:hypothetical protein
MSTQQVANTFVKIYRSEKSDEKYSLYDQNCISFELPVEGSQYEVSGLEHIKEESNKFYQRFTKIFNKIISEPLISDHGFSTVITLEVEEGGNHKVINELCTFQVREGKIVRQEFIY